MHLKLLEVLHSAVPQLLKEAPVKKPLLATAGLIGACAACCAVPLLIPVLAGISAGALTLAGLNAWLADGHFLAVGAGVVAVTLAGWGIWHVRRRSACALPGVEAPACDARGCKCP